MALNATVGSPDANSYVTEEEATVYFSDRTHVEKWEAFSNKSQALVTASQMLDWYVKWKGLRSTTTQSMAWPRTGVVRGDRSSVAIDTLPSELKVAVYELALSSLDSDRTADDPLAGIEQVKAGSLMVKADNGDNNSTARDTIPEKIYRILKDLYLSGSINVVRLMRA